MLHFWQSSHLSFFPFYQDRAEVIAIQDCIFFHMIIGMQVLQSGWYENDLLLYVP